MGLGGDGTFRLGSQGSLGRESYDPPIHGRRRRDDGGPDPDSRAQHGLQGVPRRDWAFSTRRPWAGTWAIWSRVSGLAPISAPSWFSKTGLHFWCMGGAGGAQIPVAVVNAIVHFVDGGLPFPEAVTAPRVGPDRTGGIVLETHQGAGYTHGMVEAVEPWVFRFGRPPGKLPSDESTGSGTMQRRVAGKGLPIRIGEGSALGARHREPGQVTGDLRRDHPEREGLRRHGEPLVLRRCGPGWGSNRCRGGSERCPRSWRRSMPPVSSLLQASSTPIPMPVVAWPRRD